MPLPLNTEFREDSVLMCVCVFLYTLCSKDRNVHSISQMRPICLVLTTIEGCLKVKVQQVEATFRV